jgi:hypothetical protein
MWLIALALGIPVSSIEVSGDEVCPRPADVQRQLRALLPPAGDPASPGTVEHHARVVRAGEKTHLELAGADGAPIAERELDRSGSCDELAAAAAVVLATWEGDLDPRITDRVNLPPVPRPAAPVIMARPSPPGAPLRFSLGVGLLASVSGGQLAPGAKITGSLAPAQGRLGVDLALSAVTTRSEAVGSLPGAASWRRAALAAGPRYRFGDATTTADLHVDGLAGLLLVEGVGLPEKASDTSLQLGVGAGIRATRAWGNAAPWIGVDLLVWPGHDRLEVGGQPVTGQLPRLEAQFAAGLSLGRFP